MDYIRWIRSKVGHDRIFLNFSTAIVLNEEREVLLQMRGDKHAWGLPGGALELGESAEEAVIREVYEETGLHIKVEYFQGVYTRYSDDYPNGDQAQPIAFVFVCSICGGTLSIDGEETLDLRFFPVTAAPPLFNQQQRDAFADFLHGRRGISR